MSMRENSKKIKSFKGLEDYAHLFKPSNAESEKATINSNLVVNDSNKLFKPKEDLKDKAKLFKPKEVKLTFHENLRSIRNNELKFCNFLDKRGCIKEKEALRKIFENENKFCTRDSLPFYYDEDVLTIEDRHKNILMKAELYNNEKYGDIGKGTYKSITSEWVRATVKIGESIRIFFKDDGEKVEVILIDLFHLFASDYKIESNYRDVSGYNYCMNNIRGKC